MNKSDVALYLFLFLMLEFLTGVIAYDLGYRNGVDGTASFAASFNNKAEYHAVIVVSHSGGYETRLVRSPCGVDDSSLETLHDGKLISRFHPSSFSALWDAAMRAH